jgi:hypothetical protein
VLPWSLLAAAPFRPPALQVRPEADLLYRLSRQDAKQNSMCTVVVLSRPQHAWPLLLGANRDEMADRPADPPARHWPDRPNVVAGRDVLAGGSWLGMNDEGVVAAVMNRPDSLGPAPGKRSRGELVLDALDHADAAAAAAALAQIEPNSYRPFNLLIADNRDGFWLAHRSEVLPVTVAPLPPGLSMITAHGRNDRDSARVRSYLPRFRAAPAPEPETGDAGWQAWQGLLGARMHDAAAGPFGAMCIVDEGGDLGGFGTVSSAMIALPAVDRPDLDPVFRFAAGPPDRTFFATLTL